jgi:hypothetical protein
MKKKNETIDRLKTPPVNDYWKKVYKLAIGIVTVSGAILTLPLMGIVVPAALLTGATYAVAIGGAFGISARATK